MKRSQFAISAILFLAAFIPATSGLAAAKGREIPLHDGFILAGVDGRLTVQDGNQDSQASTDRYFFEFDSDVTDGKGRVKAGVGLELLPSTALERMAIDARERSEASYRLRARVTKYKGENFIFPTHFLPVSRPAGSEPSTSEKPPLRESKPVGKTPGGKEESKPAINEPNDVLPVPQEIMRKLKAGRTVRAAQSINGVELTPDSILADRLGLVRRAQYENPHIKYAFVFDAFGRNAQRASLGLLPCEALEQAEQRQSAEPDPMRFKIAGIVTKYKGNYYLLLQKTTRVYSHGNFGR